MSNLVYTVFRRCVTGVTEYRYDRDSVSVGGAAAMIIPGYPVRIQSGQLQLCCERDLEKTVFPGCSVSLFREDIVEEYARLVWECAGHHSLHRGTDVIRVTHQYGWYQFFGKDLLLGEMHSISGPLSGEWEPRLELKLLRPVEEDLLILLLSFPILQIGI